MLGQFAGLQQSDVAAHQFFLALLFSFLFFCLFFASGGLYLQWRVKGNGRENGEDAQQRGARRDSNLRLLGEGRSLCTWTARLKHQAAQLKDYYVIGV